ncbi:MAG: 5'/3'-nucleotidase SurE [Alphaproteobacteria bacterium]
MTGSLEQARILISNDDGIDAEGIRILEQAARRLSGDVWVVAPAGEQSGKAHSFTAKGTLNALRRDERHFTVDGTPTDCLLFACNVLLKDRRPDFVFSGVNHGANLGFDVVYSGTAGAAIEGALQGIKSFAFSLSGAKNGSEFWPDVLKMIPEVVQKTAFISWKPRLFLNVNFPERTAENIAGVKMTRLSSRKIGDTVDIIEEKENGWRFNIGYARRGMIEPQSDTQAVADGFISVTPVSLDMTDSSVLPYLQTIYS